MPVDWHQIFISVKKVFKNKIQKIFLQIIINRRIFDKLIFFCFCFFLFWAELEFEHRALVFADK
jgi:hypothetical protein